MVLQLTRKWGLGLGVFAFLAILCTLVYTATANHLRSEDENDDLAASLQLELANLPIVWVLGGPGSGNSTQSTLLSVLYGFSHISTGDLLREEVAAGTAIGKQVEDIMKAGDLVPNDLVLELLTAAILKEVGRTRGFLIDGYPRDMEEALEFEDKLRPCTMALYYDRSDEMMIERIRQRGKSSGRADDTNIETIKERLQVYHKLTEPIIEYYSEKVTRIDSNSHSNLDILEKSCQAVKQLVNEPSQ